LSPPQSLAEVIRLACSHLFITCNDAGNSLQKGFPAGFHSTRFAPSTRAGIPLPEGLAEELENELEIVEVDSGMSYTPFYIPGANTAF
jgi:hypothetical protein